MCLKLIKVSLVLCLIASLLPSHGQSFSNIQAQFFEGQVQITYDLVGTASAYKVELRSSLDNFQSRIRTATGEVGENVAPGTRLTINWNPVIELPAGFDGQLQFKLVGEPMGVSTEAAVGFDFPTEGSKLKKGKTINLEWTGTSGRHNLELRRFDSKVIEIGSVSGTSFQWKYRSDLSPGKGYEVVLVNASTNKKVSGESVIIGRKVPLGLVVAPIVVVGGVAAGLAGGESGNGTTNGGTLPAPPDPN